MKNVEHCRYVGCSISPQRTVLWSVEPVQEAALARGVSVVSRVCI